MKSFGQLENTNYQEWIDERIKKKYPVEGDLLKGYDNISELTIGGLQDSMRIRFAEMDMPIWEKQPKKDNEPREVQVRFIKNAKK